ncbi:hypothetical protein TRVA0_002S00386 [Trichomonascus vanleenenianus]|uniref:uncharacterized protein n=1 Tax=Trichomonascus vanleenenianus TaxID=2268995 RepID=UPI003EC9A8DE
MGCDRIEYDPEWFPLELPQVITLRSHTPPDLMEIKNLLRTYSPPRPVVLDENPSFPLDDVLAHPPLPGQAGIDEIKIKLNREIRPLKVDRPRLFLAEITASHVPHLDEEVVGKQVVAEIFDPLALLDMPASVCSDLSYTRTAIAYNLLKDLQGRLIPKYYGSYTMKVPVEDHPEHTHRDIRVLLRQYIEGKGLNKIKPKSFNREEKQRLMKKIIAVEQEFDN